MGGSLGPPHNITVASLMKTLNCWAALLLRVPCGSMQWKQPSLLPNTPAASHRSTLASTAPQIVLWPFLFIHSQKCCYRTSYLSKILRAAYVTNGVDVDAECNHHPIVSLEQFLGFSKEVVIQSICGPDWSKTKLCLLIMPFMTVFIYDTVGWKGWILGRLFGKK